MWTVICLLFCSLLFLNPSKADQLSSSVTRTQSESPSMKISMVEQEALPFFLQITHYPVCVSCNVTAQWQPCFLQGFSSSMWPHKLLSFHLLLISAIVPHYTSTCCCSALLSGSYNQLINQRLTVVDHFLLLGYYFLF